MHHFDLYRLSGQDDLGRLDFGSALSTGICLVEWPERLREQAPAERLNMYISMLTEVLLCHSPASCLLACSSAVTTFSGIASAFTSLLSMVCCKQGSFQADAEVLCILLQEEKQSLGSGQEQLAKDEEAARSAGSEDDPEEADGEAYVDKNWRIIALHPVGEVWRQRCHAACNQMQRLNSVSNMYYIL